MRIEPDGTPVFQTRAEIRNYNVGLLLARLRPLSKSARKDAMAALRFGPWAPLLSALAAAVKAGSFGVTKP